MVYKKYVYKRGKKHGPYYYKSYREGNNVRKIYIGGEREYRDWIKRKEEIKKGRIVEQSEIFNENSWKINKNYKVVNYGKVFFAISLVCLIIAVVINALNFVNVPRSFTGLVVSENISEISSQLYGEYEDETVLEEFDTEKIKLRIKDPPKFAGEALTKNKNKRMDFNLTEGNLILYFDLLNYSEFVETAAEIVGISNVTAIEEVNITEEIAGENVTEEVEEEGIEEEIGFNITEETNVSVEENITEIEANITVPENITEEIEEVEEINETEKEEEEEQEAEEGAEETSEEIVEQLEEKQKEGKKGEKTTITGGIIKGFSRVTGSIIRGFAGITAKIIGSDVLEDNETGQEIINQTETIETIDNTAEAQTIDETIEVISTEEGIVLEEIREKISEMSDEDIENIADTSVIKAENFEIDVNETKLEETKEKPEYKWGYKVELKDMNFMAKVEVTFNQDISQWDKSTLKIGNNLLSFQDLVDAGYKVKIDIPSLEMNISDLTAANVTISNITEEIEEENVTKEMNKTEEERGEEQEAEEGAEETSEEIVEQLEEKQKEGKKGEKTTIAGGIIRTFFGITGRVAKAFETIMLDIRVTEEPVIKDLIYNYTVTVYIEKDFNEYNELMANQTNETISEEIEEMKQESTEEKTEAIKTNETTAEINETITTVTGNVVEESSLLEKETSERKEETTNETILEDFDIPLISVIPKIEYEDLDNSGDVSIGDIIYLDPTLITITFEDVTIDADLVNITAEVNFTHLNISDTAPYDSLVLYMPFDSNASATSVYDYTKNNNDGTITNAFYTSSGVYGGAMEFDGDGDYIEIDNMNLSNENGAISAWIYPIESGDVQHFIWGGPVAGDGWGVQNETHLGTSNPANGYFNFFYEASPNSDCSTTSTTNYSQALNQWYHVVGTYDGTSCSIYVNGILENTDSAVGSMNSEDWNSKVYIGRPGTSTRYFNGTIDDVMIFNTSLTAPQILEIYNNQSVRFLAAGTQAFANQSKLNISTGYSQVQVTGDYQALMGSSINLSIGQYYSESWTYTDAQVYDGDNTFTIDSQTTNLTLNFTFYAGNLTNPFYSPLLSSAVQYLVVNVSDTIAPDINITYPENETYQNYVIYLNYTVDDEGELDVCWYSNETGAWNSTSVTAGNNWTLDGNSSLGSNIWTVYCNDTAGNENSTSVTFSIDDMVPDINFTEPTPSDGATQGWDSIYVNVTANDTNIGNISTFIDFDNSLIGWWRMDDVNETGDVVDYLGINNGTAVGNAVQTDAGYFGKGFSFDGTGDYVDNGDIGIDPENDFTVSVWLKSEDISAYMTAVGLGHSSIDSLLFIGYHSTGQARVLFREDDNSNVVNVFQSGSALDDGIFHHLVFVFNPSVGTYGVYVDGSVIESKAHASYTSITFDKQIIGGHYSQGTAFPMWNGQVDDLMIFNRSLSAEEILSLYANQSSRYLEVNFTGLSDGSHTFKAYTQDLAGNVNETEEREVSISTMAAPSGNKFVITNSTNDNVASIDDKGDVYLKETAIESQTSLTPPENSFIVQNVTGDVIAYINSSGSLLLLGTITKNSATLTPGTSNLEFRNSTDDLIAFFSNTGNLTLFGGLAENYASP